MEKHEDIQSALARPALETNEADLEEELAELMKEDSQNPPPDGGLNISSTSDLEKSFEKLSLKLPDVPDSSPDVSMKEMSMNQ